MKKVFAKINVIVVLIAFSLLVVGCGLFFNPSKYVRASFDALYKGQFEDYSKMTSSTIDQIERQYDTCCEAQVDVSIFNRPHYVPKAECFLMRTVYLAKYSKQINK